MEYELEIVKGKVKADPLEMVQPVMSGKEVLAMQTGGRDFCPRRHLPVYGKISDGYQEIIR